MVGPRADADLNLNLDALLGSAFEVFWFFAFFEPAGRKNA